MFGGICIGNQLALTEVTCAFVKIVAHSPRIERADSLLDFVEDWKMTTVSANGANVEGTQRTVFGGEVGTLVGLILRRSLVRIR